MVITETEKTVTRVRKTARDVLTIAIVPYVSKDSLETTVSGRAPRVVESRPVIKNLDFVLGDVSKDIFLKAQIAQLVHIAVSDAVEVTAVHCARLVTGDKHAKSIVQKFVTDVARRDNASVVSCKLRNLSKSSRD